MAQQGRGELTCTPHGLVDKYPCLKCASKTELLALIALAAYAVNHAGDTTLTDMLNDGACFKCLSDHQMLEAIAAAIIAIAVEYGYFTDVTDALHTAKCLTCEDPALVRGISVKAICEYINGVWPLEV